MKIEISDYNVTLKYLNELRTQLSTIFEVDLNCHFKDTKIVFTDN